MASESEDDKGETRLKGLAGLSPGFFLAVNMVELVVLVLLAVAWQWQWRGFHHDQLPAVLWGCLPIAVPWAAAWGGWLISVKGVVGYWRKFNSPKASVRNAERLEWNAWHLVRVPTGIVLGTVGALLAVIFAGVVSTSDDGHLDTTPLGTLTIALVAFVLAYRQESFDALVRRVTDLIMVKADRALAEEEDDADGPGDRILTRVSPFWRAPVNGTGTNSVVVVNHGAAEVALPDGSIKITGPDAGSFTLDQPPTSVPANGAVLVPIGFKPTEQRTYKAQLEVQLGDRAGTLSITGYGNAPPQA